MIVDFTLAFIAQSLIGLIDSSKLLFGTGVLINVWVVFLGKLEVRLLDLVLVGRTRHIQGLVEVLIIQHLRGTEGPSLRLSQGGSLRVCPSEEVHRHEVSLMLIHHGGVSIWPK